MRTRLVAAMTAAILAVPCLSAAAASADHKCGKRVGTEHKCEKTKG